MFFLTDVPLYLAGCCGLGRPSPQEECVEVLIAAAKRSVPIHSHRRWVFTRCMQACLLQEAIGPCDHMIKWIPTAAFLCQTSVTFSTEIIFVIHALAKYSSSAITGSVAY